MDLFLVVKAQARELAVLTLLIPGLNDGVGAEAAGKVEGLLAGILVLTGALEAEDPLVVASPAVLVLVGVGEARVARGGLEDDVRHFGETDGKPV